MKKDDLKLENENKLVIEIIKKEAIECVETLTTHGLPNLSRTKYTFIKFIWLLLTISSAGVSVYFIVETLAEYSEYNVTTEVRLINAEESLEFPTISICNKNRFSTNYSKDLVNDLIKSEYNQSFEEFFYSNNTKQKLDYLVEFQDYHASKLFQNIGINEREKYTLSMKDALLYCQFDQKDCTYSDFEWFFNSKYGNCYKFNSNGLKMISKENYENGLIIELHLKNPEELDVLDFQHDLFVSIDSKNLDTYSDFENLIEISTGFQTSIKIQKSLFQK